MAKKSTWGGGGPKKSAKKKQGTTTSYSLSDIKEDFEEAYKTGDAIGFHTTVDDFNSLAVKLQNYMNSKKWLDETEKTDIRLMLNKEGITSKKKAELRELLKSKIKPIEPIIEQKESATKSLSPLPSPSPSATPSASPSVTPSASPSETSSLSPESINVDIDDKDWEKPIKRTSTKKKQKKSNKSEKKKSLPKTLSKPVALEPLSKPIALEPLLEPSVLEPLSEPSVLEPLSEPLSKPIALEPLLKPSVLEPLSVPLSESLIAPVNSPVTPPMQEIMQTPESLFAKVKREWIDTNIVTENSLQSIKTFVNNSSLLRGFLLEAVPTYRLKNTNTDPTMINLREYVDELCKIFVCVGIITKLIQKKTNYQILTKGGKAAQILLTKNPYISHESNDIDISLLPLGTYDKEYMRKHAKNIGYLVMYLCNDSGKLSMIEGSSVNPDIIKISYVVRKEWNLYEPLMDIDIKPVPDPIKTYINPDNIIYFNGNGTRLSSIVLYALQTPQNFVDEKIFYKSYYNHLYSIKCKNANSAECALLKRNKNKFDDIIGKITMLFEPNVNAYVNYKISLMQPIVESME